MAPSAARSQAGLESARLSSTLYFASESEETDKRTFLHNQIAGEVRTVEAASFQDLPDELDRCEALISQLETHDAYLKAKALENTGDLMAKAASHQVRVDQSVLKSAMDVRLSRLSPQEAGALGKYRYLAQKAQADPVHDLSPDAEKYRAALVTPTLNSFADAWDRIDEGLSRPKATKDLDTATRREALARWDAANDAAASEEATLLGAIVEVENRDAVAKGYNDAADRKYQARGMSDALVAKTLALVEAEAPAYRHYQEVIAKHAAQRLGVPQVLSTETDLASTKAPAISLSNARSLILASLQPLGSDYTERFAALLNPANGRLDLAGGEHRARTGTSIDAYEAPTALYYSGYDGSLRAVSIIAHEGGHAIHRELMNAGGTPVYVRSGPSYFYEGYAIFNELLLLDFASRTAKTSEEKQYALERMLSKVSLELFVSAEEAAFERSLYTASVGRALLDRKKIDSLFQSSLAPYEYWPATDVGQSRGWMHKALLFEDPLYLVNYLYASVIAVALFEKSHTDPQFAANYDALLRRGFDAEPQAILASLGIRLDDPDLVKPGSRLLTEKTNELEVLYGQQIITK